MIITMKIAKYIVRVQQLLREEEHNLTWTVLDSSKTYFCCNSATSWTYLLKRPETIFSTTFAGLPDASACSDHWSVQKNWKGQCGPASYKSHAADRTNNTSSIGNDDEDYTWDVRMLRSCCKASSATRSLERNKGLCATICIANDSPKVESSAGSEPDWESDGDSWGSNDKSPTTRARPATP